MKTADFWLQKIEAAEAVLLTDEQILQYNAQIVNNPVLGVVDFADYPVSLPAESRLTMLTSRCWPTGILYKGARCLDEEYYAELQTEMNLPGVSTGPLLYGYTVKRTAVRAFPTCDFIVDRMGDLDIDHFQDTALDPAEPLVLLHQSLSGSWWFIQCVNYRGWVNVEDIAISSSRGEWLRYLQQEASLLVSGKQLRLAPNPYSPDLSELVFAMGARIPLAASAECQESVDHQCIGGSYVILLPRRNENGELYFKQALVPLSEQVVSGRNLPYTRHNILRQAFRMLGERYGWGGLFDSHDCSAFIMNIYRCFGFRLPRDAGEQAQIPGTTVSFAGLSIAARERLLAAMPSGAMLHFPGHVMLYLGEHAGRFFVIHAIAACGDVQRQQENGKLARLPLNTIMVHDLALRRVNGQTLLESITVAKVIE